jgi:hypothetical protein
LLGGELENGFIISPKYIGQRRLIEIAIATLTTDRALLLLGVPGTAKSWVSEHLSAAISGDSTLLVQGTAGTSEEAMRYGWNYARLLAEGPSEKALVPSPIMNAMKDGKIARIEELTRIPADVQDTLITILSEATPRPCGSSIKNLSSVNHWAMFLTIPRWCHCNVISPASKNVCDSKLKSTNHRSRSICAKNSISIAVIFCIASTCSTCRGENWNKSAA